MRLDAAAKASLANSQIQKINQVLCTAKSGGIRARDSDPAWACIIRRNLEVIAAACRQTPIYRQNRTAHHRRLVRCDRASIYEVNGTIGNSDDVIDATSIDIANAGNPRTLDRLPTGADFHRVIREDLLGHASPQTPTLLDYATLQKDDSLTNTTNTFAIYVVKLMLQWLKDQGGVAAIEQVNRKKAARLYQVLDGSGFYKGFSRPEFRSIMNVTFNLATEELEAKFLKEALSQGLYALEGHRNVGGIRASIYNPMPMAGVEALVSFMEEFEKKNG